MNETASAFKVKLIETFKAFDEFCNLHNIKYYATGGTLIGAIRHKGLIPWDDDVDVWMLREDYNKFCSFRGKVDGHYDIMDSRDENYWLLSLAKFVDTSTTLWEIEHYPCVTGVYIDVFPLDESDYDSALALRKEYDRTSLNLTYAMTSYSSRQFKNAFWGGHFYLFFKLLKDTFYYRPRYNRYLAEYNECVRKIKELKGDYYVAFDGLYGQKEIYKKEWLSEIIRLPFENIMINAPKYYHEILSQIYGDYMKLPPKEKQVSHHSHYFLDLDRRWSIEEIKNIRKSIKN